MSSHQVLWINSIIKHCVSCWITYILQDDTRSIQYEDKYFPICHMTFITILIEEFMFSCPPERKPYRNSPNGESSLIHANRNSDSETWGVKCSKKTISLFSFLLHRSRCHVSINVFEMNSRGAEEMNRPFGSKWRRMQSMRKQLLVGRRLTSALVTRSHHADTNCYIS